MKALNYVPQGGVYLLIILLAVYKGAHSKILSISFIVKIGEYKTIQLYLPKYTIYREINLWFEDPHVIKGKGYNRTKCIPHTIYKFFTEFVVQVNTTHFRMCFLVDGYYESFHSELEGKGRIKENPASLHYTCFSQITYSYSKS